MSNRFKRPDAISDVGLIVCIILGIVFGTLDIVNGAVLNGIVIIVVTLIGALVVWAFLKVFLHLCSDVRFIRNKLGESNEIFNNVSRDSMNNINDVNENVVVQSKDEMKDNDSKITDVSVQLREIKQSYDDGIMTKTEFDAGKERLLNRNRN